VFFVLIEKGTDVCDDTENMDTNFKNNTEKIAAKIKEKIPSLRCPACSHTEFSFTDGYFAHDIQDDLVNRHMGGKNVPVIPVACKNCGFIMEFAAGVLGFLPKDDTAKK
jgi:RNase P subunit RPR2